MAVGSGWPDTPIGGPHWLPTIPHRHRHPHPAAADVFPVTTTVSTANTTPPPSRRRRLLCIHHTCEHGYRDPSSIPPATFSTRIARPFPPTRHSFSSGRYLHAPPAIRTRLSLFFIFTPHLSSHTCLPLPPGSRWTRAPLAPLGRSPPTSSLLTTHWAPLLFFTIRMPRLKWSRRRRP